jgi:hypothetical protein
MRTYCVLLYRVQLLFLRPPSCSRSKRSALPRGAQGSLIAFIHVIDSATVEIAPDCTHNHSTCLR